MSTVRLGIACSIALLAGGCQYFEEVRPAVFTQGRDVSIDSDLVPGPFPADTPIGAAYDIEVVAEKGRVIRLDNRTVSRYEDAELWLNQQYAGRVGSIEIGANDPIALDGFINEHGERYPIARFLANDKFSPLVSADLIVEGKMHKLLVRLENWRHP